MRALLQEREFQSRSQPASNSVGVAGNNILYFGCKNKNVDYIYQDEISDYSNRKVITSLHLAFSRDQANKVYVQNLLNEPENSQKFMESIQAGGSYSFIHTPAYLLTHLLTCSLGYVYVCGATSMGNDVHETIVQIIMKHNKYSSKQQALDVVKSLQTNGRYVQELWST
jgi:NADPH-ferrihemoprotein reductase